MTDHGRTLPPPVRTECHHISGAADAVAAIGAVLQRDAIARNCEDGDGPLDESVIGGLYSGIEALGEFILARVEALERHCLATVPAPTANSGEAPGELS